MINSNEREERKPRSRARKLLIVAVSYFFITFVLISAVNYVSAVYSAKNAKPVWAEWQQGYYDFLVDSYNGDPTFMRVSDESELYTSDMQQNYNSQTKFNELRYMATHNSYKAGLTDETALLYHVPFAAFMGHQYDYVFDTVTEQLSCGIRSFEFDPGKVKTEDGFKIECIHSDKLETNSTMVDMQKGFEEIKMWMDRNPDSVPISILIEPKGGKSFDAEAFDTFDGILFEVFGDKLMTPKDFLGELADFDEFRKADAYPTVDSMRGKIVVFLHEKPSLDAYIARDPSMQNSAMCIALEYRYLKNKHPEYSKYGFMAIINNASRRAKWVTEAVTEGNYMVRSRIDKYDVISEKSYKAALDLNANILSTDYPPQVLNRLYEYPVEVSAKYDYMAVLYEVGKTLALRNV